MITRLFSTLCLIFFSIISFAQAESGLGTIKGTILTSDNKPVGSATVWLKSTRKASLTNNNGAFSIETIRSGNYTLEVSSIGYQPFEKEVTVIAGSSTDLSIQLSETQTQLTEVIVSAGRT